MKDGLGFCAKSVNRYGQTWTCGVCAKKRMEFLGEKELLAHARNHVRDGKLEELPGPRFKPRMR